MPYATTSSVQLYYEVSGNGSPVLFLSGTGWSAEHWKIAQVPFFSDQHRTVVFDYRGVGRSDRPIEPYSTRTFANDAVELLGAIGIDEPAHIVGHSMGGRVAQWIALDHPERVRSLVLAASGPGDIDLGRPRFPGISPELVAEVLKYGWPGFAEQLLHSAQLFHRADPGLIEQFAATHRGRFGTDVVSYLRHVDARQRHDTSDLLSKIAAPTLVVVGSADTHGSPNHIETSEFLAKSIQGAQFELIADTAHALQIEAAETFNRLIEEFITRH